MDSVKQILGNRKLLAAIPLAVFGGRIAAKVACESINQRVYSRINRDVDSTGASVKSTPRKLTPEQWREDLLYLAEEMPKRFIDFDWLVNRQSFDSAVSRLDQKIPSLTRDQIILELMRIVALANAGHTIILPWHPAIDWHVLPLRLYVFDDGVYVTHASRRYRKAVGAKVVGIGNASIEQILEETKPYIAADNDVHAKFMFCQVIAPFAEIFRAFGYTDSIRKVTFELEREGGERFILNVKPVSFGSPLGIMSLWPMYTHINGINPPAIISNRSNRYKFEFWDGSKTIYFKFSGVRDNPEGETIAEFTKRLGQFVDAHDFDRLIVDIRHNGGGNNFLVRPLVKLLSENERINQRGKLFTIIDRETFSAAVSFATALERRTKTLFVGEPSGGTPNTIGDPDSLLELPNSRLIVRLSWRYWRQSAVEDNRPAIFPDVSVVLTSHEYFNERDPAIEAILAYKPEPIKQIEFDEAQRARFSGRYLFNPNQLLEITDTQGRLQITITDFEDFVKSDLYPVSESRLLTDMTDVEVHLPQGSDAPVVSCKGVEIPLRQVSEDFMTPIQALQVGRLDEAIEGFRKNKSDGARLDARLEMAMTSIGINYLNLGKRNEALSTFRLCLEMMPLSMIGVERAIEGLGCDFLTSGESGLAVDCFTCGVELFPNSADMHANLAEAYIVNGERERAIDCCKTALRMEPGLKAVREILKKVG